VNTLLDKIHQEKVSCVYLGRLGHNLPFTIYLTKPVKGLDDLKGLKIRCSPTLIGFLKKIGANPWSFPLLKFTPHWSGAWWTGIRGLQD